MDLRDPSDQGASLTLRKGEMEGRLNESILDLGSV